eukprot:14506266-Alexandrium_andersonii.AAC.1
MFVERLGAERVGELLRVNMVTGSVKSLLDCFTKCCKEVLEVHVHPTDRAVFGACRHGRLLNLGFCSHIACIAAVPVVTEAEKRRLVSRLLSLEPGASASKISEWASGELPCVAVPL